MRNTNAALGRPEEAQIYAVQVDIAKYPRICGFVAEVPDQPRLVVFIQSVMVDHSGPNLVFTPRGDEWKELGRDVWVKVYLLRYLGKYR